MKREITMMNTTALAYMGDAVYEVFIRKYAMAKEKVSADRLHAFSVRYVRAAGQAKAVKAMMKDFLTEEEIALVKRARNHRTSSRPKNADPVEYKLATAFEALIGALYLSGEAERLEEVAAKAIEIIEEP